MQINPFRPSAGAEPPRIIGRDQAAIDFVAGLEGGVGAPGRLMRITGPRGSGKTVLLTELGSRAEKMGWAVVHVSAGFDLIDDLVYELSPCLSVETISGTGSVAVASADVTARVKSPNLRSLMKAAAQAHRGLVVTVDEVQDASVEDIQRIALSVQHLIREKVDIAFVFAGLPMGVLDVINGEALTFLRRAKSVALDEINLVEVGISLQDSFAATGLTLQGEELSQTARATCGYAYLIQLVAYYIWQRADLHRGKSVVVDTQDVQLGTEIAMAQFCDAVYEPAVAGINEGALSYLLAMAQDEQRSSTAEVAKRMGKTPKEVTSYRRTLLQREIIQSPARGYVEFAIPFMRDYLRDNQAELLNRY